MKDIIININNSDSLVNILKDIVNRSISCPSFERERKCYEESIKTLIKVLEESN